MAKSFNEKMVEILKTDLRFVDDEGELVKAAVIDRAWKIERDLVKLLLSKPDIKKKFFDEIDRLFDPKVLTNWKRYTEDFGVSDEGQKLNQSFYGDAYDG